MIRKQLKSGSGPETNSPKKASRRTPLWQALLLPVALDPGLFRPDRRGLALFGVQPALQNQDPFVGFASHAPLFVSSTGANGEQLMTTAPNKKDFFNRQSFPRQKAPNTYRIFTLGGSTTYGRPYDDSTSFSRLAPRAAASSRPKQELGGNQRRRHQLRQLPGGETDGRVDPVSARPVHHLHRA